ncbi:hypothetical protein SAMN02982917_2918 [Azospirillum oryzae]|uniref:Uncharacterized protein n=1 Tax=Azospirillum oryzae TaxID=286727 RepID=A0A1X7FJ99_9PROT|nr:hypothetical protein [Azospirillum oryzae]SMF52759.1 hypothetical protein SAMN02982917_2918 [Azospirillum oryzae]
MNTHSFHDYAQGGFWLVFIVSAVLLVLRISSAVKLKDVPHEFCWIMRTSFGAEHEVVIKYSNFVKAYRDREGVTYKYFNENGQSYFESASSYIVGATRESLKRGMSTKLIVDSNDFSSHITSGIAPEEKPISNNKRFVAGRYMVDCIEIKECFDFTGFSDLIILNVVISAPRGIITFRNCWIVNIELKSEPIDADIDVHRLFLVGCHVGMMRINPESVGSLIIDRSVICNLRCKGSEHRSPFREITISNDSQILSPRINEDGGYFGVYSEDMQALRNFRGHLEARGELSALAVVRSNEMRIERIKQDTFLKVVSFCYDAISDFGGKPYRPLAWTISLFIFNVLMIYANNWAMTSLDCSKSSVIESWQAQLCGDYYLNGLARSFFLSAQTIINPFGIIGGDPPVRATNIVLHLWINLTSFISIAALAISFSGVRRQFRLEK